MADVPDIGASDELVATLNKLKDRQEPATVGGQAAVLAALVRFVDAMIAVSAVATSEKSLEKITAVHITMERTLHAVRDAVDTLKPIADEADNGDA